MIEREGEVDACRDGDAARPRNNPLMLASDGEDARLTGVDDRFEAVGAAQRQVCGRMFKARGMP